MLRYVWDRSPFYRDFYAGHGVKPEHLAELSIRDLPLLPKKALIDSFDRAVTDRRLRKAELAEWFETHHDPAERYLDDFVAVHGSGTSGDIGIFVYDLKEWRIADATMAARMPPPESYPEGKTRVAFYVATHGHFITVSMAHSMPSSVYDTLVLSLLSPADEVVEQLNAFQPDRLHGYASSIARLAEMARAGRLRIRPRRIVVGGDKLTPGLEQVIRDAWDVPLHVFYAASESKYIAARDPGASELAVLEDLNILEVLGDDDRPVPTGREGRVVLTNLSNRTLPMIRYELGDFVVMGKPGLRSGAATILDIVGRANDALPVVLDAGGHDTIHPIVLTTFYVPGMEKMQFVSELPDHVRIDYVAGEDLDDAVGREFRVMLARKKATRTTVAARRVADIGNDPQTGKLRLVKIEGAGRAKPARVAASIPTAARGSGTLQVVSNRAGQHSICSPSEPIPGGWTATGREGDASRCVEHIRELRANRIGRPSAGEIADDGRVHRLVEARAEATPDRAALLHEGRTLSYGELNARANRLARRLQATGVGPESLVAICLPRSIDVVIGILATLKAGGAWLPLDPLHPSQRLDAVLRDSRPVVLLTQPDMESRLPEHQVRVLRLDDAAAPGRAEDARNLELRAPDDALAYVMYTSGSTGQPKGVMVSHGNLARYVCSMAGPLAIGVSDVYLHTAPFTFSSSVRQLLVPLTAGASVVIAGVEASQQPLRWLETIKQARVTIVDTVPSFWRSCLDVVESLDGPSRSALLDNELVRLVTASEPLLPDLPRRWVDACGHRGPIVNMFGQTETAGIVATHPIDAGAPVTTRTVAIGSAIPGVATYVLDDRQEPVPVGETGELCLAGDGVGRGYLNQPDLTAERFVPDPFGTAGTRLYRTGDLARYLPDGSLEHLGRIDQQVKVRGMRIEPGEVEGALVQHPAVRETAVVAREDGDGLKRLVAYVALRPDHAPTVNELRRFSRTKLPDYMVPSVFVKVTSLPRTSSGKVDRRALPSPTPERPELEKAYVGPRTPVERVLAGIWAEVLGLERVGVHDDFFDLGGHSLSVSQLVRRVHETLGVDVQLSAVFDAPSVADMGVVAGRLISARAAGRSEVVKDIEEMSEEEAERLLNEALERRGE
jgi:amino acid adenylation domain-containing protein